MSKLLKFYFFEFLKRLVYKKIWLIGDDFVLLCIEEFEN